MSTPIHENTYRDVKAPSFWCRWRHSMRWQRPINRRVICLTCLRRFPVDFDMLRFPVKRSALDGEAQGVTAVADPSSLVRRVRIHPHLCVGFGH
jgi:hypothetical protein